MGKLPLPRGPVVRHVVSPEIHLVADALLREKRTEPAGRVERTGGVLPLSLAADEQQRGAAPQPVEMVTAEVRDVIHRIVEVDRFAAVAATLDRDVVDAAHADRERK